MALILLLLGCAAHVVQPAAREGETFDVVVASASGDRKLSSLVVLEVVPDREGTARFTTIRSEGTWEEGGRALAFDSDRPTAADPWFLRIQHLVASVPAVVQLDDAGAPASLVDVEGWRSTARARVYGADLPVQALQIGETLLDPDGLVRGLRRDFPGIPPETGPWTRTERLGGLDAARTETCTVETGRTTIWTCSGLATGPTDGPARLHEVTTSTVLEADRKGLVRLESTTSGTLVVLGPEGTSAIDRPIAERRLVQRR